MDGFHYLKLLFFVKITTICFTFCRIRYNIIISDLSSTLRNKHVIISLYNLKMLALKYI